MLINRLPSLGAWLYTESRRTGFDVGLDFVQGRARVGCYIRLPGGGGKPANIAALLALNERKEDIEAQFGGTLEWLELPDKTGTRICAFFDGSPNLPEEMWPVLQDEMIDALIRLDAALQRPIAEIAL